MPRTLAQQQRLELQQQAREEQRHTEELHLLATSALSDVPHMLGCLRNEQKLTAMETYLRGELDYKPARDYSPEVEKRIETLELKMPDKMTTRLTELELKIPAYEGHAEIIAEEAADMTGAYNDLNRQIHSIQIDIKDIKQALHIIITTLKKITK